MTIQLQHFQVSNLPLQHAVNFAADDSGYLEDRVQEVMLAVYGGYQLAQDVDGYGNDFRTPTPQDYPPLSTS